MAVSWSKQSSFLATGDTPPRCDICLSVKHGLHHLELALVLGRPLQHLVEVDGEVGGSTSSFLNVLAVNEVNTEKNFLEYYSRTKI